MASVLPRSVHRSGYMATATLQFARALLEGPKNTGLYKSACNKFFL